ncbi:RnfABCDGE type electron transport complex subunit C [Entomospira culicis]|uniref:RnfABCDGE type electron transport complex subunit C n=1 Tax=Entomospira culicis TaxID=2719989 RepID=A0A968KZM1_9SPIO|nr:RnfABCDGE type electron transport complex subunit C [Entomospira culicis]NIZ19609.1 RnfABCDGE type electron transport complex subunit C [Entomospira culicis]NIZ69486.1 RnfABCDGE type electron transport complex subunit C [Entomospira culicis]WDI36601.1 RnfABCDGE type electron transport complex subunit C [Entomospira culicis]WDI38229.1 RnfABCDGE type electron transport complex subunit C [Entomospira culicis]
MRISGVKAPNKPSNQADDTFHFAAIPIIASYPVLQHAGKEALPVVHVGDRVEEGMLIAKATTMHSANIHSAIPGEVKAITSRVHVNGKKMLFIDVATGGRFRVQAKDAVRDYSNWNKQQILSELSSKGVVELDGSAVPIHIKWTTKEKSCSILVVDASEVDAYLSLAQQLLKEQLTAITSGIAIAARLLEPKTIVLVSNRTFSAELQTLSQSLKEITKLEVRELLLDAKYPYRHERLMVYSLTQERLLPSVSAEDKGMVISNIATFIASYEALAFAKPLIDRAISVAGAGVKHSRSLIAKLGTPIGFLLEECGGLTAKNATIVAHTAMLGKMVIDLDTPLTKEMVAIMALLPKETKSARPTACSGCSACFRGCPLSLAPREMYQSIKANRLDIAHAYGLSECITCGLCSYHCPARLELSQTFVQAQDKPTLTGRQ